MYMLCLPQPIIIKYMLIKNVNTYIFYTDFIITFLFIHSCIFTIQKWSNIGGIKNEDRGKWISATLCFSLCQCVKCIMCCCLLWEWRIFAWTISMFKRLIICKIYHHLPQTEHIQITYGYATNVTSNIPCKTHNNYIRFLLF